MNISAKYHSEPVVDEEIKLKSIIDKGKSSVLRKVRHEAPKTWIDSLDLTLSLFLKYLEDERRYTFSSRESQIRKLKCFTKYLTDNTQNENGGLEKNFSDFTMKEIITYEDYLIYRHNNGEIQLSTLYKYLYVIQLYVDFLRKNNKILFDYTVPSSLKHQGKRTNAYASTQDIIKLIGTAEQYSNFKIRDLCILLLIMELGCRPIEVTRLVINDLRPSESLITLFCEKSGQRTLKISKDLSKVFKKYLYIRNEYSPNHDFVFINTFGEPLSSSGVSSMITRFNKKAFGKAKINAKALRHTYATNALDNLNDFDEVSKSMGHLNWTSTEYYVHKSVKRLLQNSLPFNPLHQLVIGDEINAH
ncbi:tyrosine-type recombinase/integrase [Bacillus alkalicellulosilyticus]|uniref:tyrosine-type recombinase/integrase n=1 Tax=Alkalihalobacterium alkalicellulosilyticum TaxID=1912214 RepID=UPI000998852B|nr:tyrosine-type recombinase/integrase [Bacillus alkalicellulosilyticus]